MMPGKTISQELAWLPQTFPGQFGAYTFMVYPAIGLADQLILELWPILANIVQETEHATPVCGLKSLGMLGSQLCYIVQMVFKKLPSMRGLIFSGMGIIFQKHSVILISCFNRAAFTQDQFLSR